MSNEVPVHRFDEATVAGIVGHMNVDHAEDTLLICRTLGGHPTAEAAEMVGLDGAGGDYRVSAGGHEEVVRIPWSRHIDQRPEVRAEVVKLYEAACAAAGIRPRAH